jgi:hypothetical protein
MAKQNDQHAVAAAGITMARPTAIPSVSPMVSCSLPSATYTASASALPWPTDDRAVIAVEAAIAGVFVVAAAGVTGPAWLLVAGLTGHGFKDL